MNQARRQKELLTLVNEKEWVSVEDAVAALGSSAATVRRDMNDLEQSGGLRRVRGGAQRLDSESLPFSARQSRATTEKDVIAKAAVSLLREGDVVLIDGGTTTLHVGLHLPRIPLTVVTNSVRLATLLDDQPARHPDLRVSLTGGVLMRGSGLLVGPEAQDSLRKFHADWAFLSAAGIDSSGIFNSNELVVESERIMITNATRVAVLLDHTKIGRRAMRVVAGLSEIDVLVCDESPELSGAAPWLSAAEVETIGARK